ncbi:glycosyltransferase [Candidatus Pacearchaeota archaeon]|nr:glycosyltransferase [Candidatus Pacearchaeota archaeon]
MKKEDNHLPKLSVVMPVYNIEEYLEESIMSILSQTFSDFELIIIFNGTTDNSFEIAKRYAQKDKRIKLIYLSRPNVQKAMNRGFEVATGRYIARMDGDDVCLPNRFKIQVNYLERNNEVFLIGSSAEIIDEKGKKMGLFRKYNSPNKIKKQLLKSNCIIHPSIMFRNTQEFFYREKFKCSEDYDLYLRILSPKKKITNLPEILIKYRIRRNSFVSTKPNQEFFFQKAKEFYWQREKTGKDYYENLSPPRTNTEKPNFDKLNLSVKIVAKFQDNQMKESRRNIKKYFKEFGIDKMLILYYLLSFFPNKFILFLKKNF